MRPAQTADDFFGFDRSMKMPLIFSSGFHLIIFILATVGLPFIIKEPPMISTPISVEIITKAKVTQTPTPAPAAPKPPAPATMTEEKPPDLTAAPEPEKPKEDKKDIAPEAIPDPTKKPEPPKKDLKKEEKKPDPAATKVEKAEPKKDFSSLLKNLTPELEETPKPNDSPTMEDILKDAQAAPLGEQLSVSELDAIKHQLGQCWVVMAGAKYAEDLIVAVRVTINRDRTVNDATILDQGRYNRDSAFRAAAESAIRALRNPRCTPLELPPEKYNEWKTTVITFDPREMLQ